MFDYIVILLIISLLIITVFHLFKNRFSITPRMLHFTVGISFLLGAIFPIAISTLNALSVIFIYFALIFFSATAISYAESKIFLNTPPVPFELAEEHNNDHASYIPGKNYPPYQGTSSNEPEINLNTTAETDIAICTDDIPDKGINSQEDLKEVYLSPPPSDIPACKATEEPGNQDNNGLVGDQETALPLEILISTHEELHVGVHEDVLVSIREESLVGEYEENSGFNGDESITVTETKSIDSATVNEYISAGFHARSTGNMSGALESFFKALELVNECNAVVYLAMEISSIYQELGHNLQAEMILRSALVQNDIAEDKNSCDLLDRQLIQLKNRSLETAIRLEELNGGSKAIEKQSTDS